MDLKEIIVPGNKRKRKKQKKATWVYRVKWNFLFYVVAA